MYRIDFTKEELKIIACGATDRFCNSLNREFSQKDGQKESDQIAYHFRGIMGEWAFCKLFNIKYDPETDGFGKADFGSKIDIKTNMSDSPMLYISKYQLKPGMVYILFQIQGFSATLVGGMSSEKFNQKKIKHQSRPIYFVEKIELTPAEELLTTRYEFIKGLI